MNSEPDSVDLGPGSVDLGLGFVDSGAVSVDLGPGSVDLEPGSVDLEPGSVGLGPGSVGLEPGCVDLGFRLIELCPTMKVQIAVAVNANALTLPCRNLHSTPHLNPTYTRNSYIHNATVDCQAVRNSAHSGIALLQQGHGVDRCSTPGSRAPSSFDPLRRLLSACSTTVGSWLAPKWWVPSLSDALILRLRACRFAAFPVATALGAASACDEAACDEAACDEAACAAASLLLSLIVGTNLLAS